MGIKTIVPLTEVPSKKHLEDLENRIQCLSGRRIGKWSLVHAEYTPVLEEDNEAMSEFANRLQVLGEMADHPTPDTVHFALIDDVPLDSSILEFGRNERRNIFVLEARKPFIDVVETIGVYKRRHTERVEGLKYDVGDFSLKLGARYVHERKMSGFMVEVEYKPCFKVAGTSDILEEFLKVVVPKDFPLSTPLRTSFSFLDESIQNVYSYSHTVIQYLNLFKSFPVVGGT